MTTRRSDSAGSPSSTSQAAASRSRRADGAIWLVCNGEIYNHGELRTRLEADGYRFLTHSDCEVILALYERYGDKLLDHLRGMFAFALWDSRKRRLLAARDHLGQKPLLLRKHRARIRLRLGDQGAARLRPVAAADETSKRSTSISPCG